MMYYGLRDFGKTNNKRNNTTHLFGASKVTNGIWKIKRRLLHIFVDLKRKEKKRQEC